MRNPLSAGAYATLACTCTGLVTGCTADHGSPFLTRLNMSRDDGRSVVRRRMWTRCGLDQLDPWLLGDEVLQGEKHGTASMLPGYFRSDPGQLSMDDQVRKYFTPRKRSVLGDPECKRAALAADQAVRSLVMGKGRLRSRSIYSVIASGKKRSSCGLPWMMTAAITPLEYLNAEEEIIADGYPLHLAGDNPAFVAVRSVPRGPAVHAKYRIVYAMSRIDNDIAGMIFNELYDEMIGREEFCAWVSREAVDYTVTRIMKSQVGGPNFSIDFEAYDASVPEEVIDRIFGIYTEWFQEADTPLIRYCQEAFKRTGIIVPSATKRKELDIHLDRTGGIPSGSKLTNMVGSHCNIWALNYAAAKLRGRVCHITVQGDDALARFQGVTKEDLCGVLLQDLGMRLSPTKTLVEYDKVMFLQNIHSTSYEVEGRYVGVRPLMRVLNGMMSYEKGRRNDWSPLMDSVRWLQQLDNASSHPRFSEACGWLLEEDRVLPEALFLIANNDRELLSQAYAVMGGFDDHKTRLCDLYRSPVVRECQRQMRRKT